MNIKDEISHQRLEEAIYITNKFLNVISDGYFPVTITIQRNEHKLGSEDEIIKTFIKDSQMEINVWDKKSEFNDLSQKLHDTFEWMLAHLKTFNVAPKIFASKFHTDNLNEIVDELCKKILELVENQHIKQFEYFFEMGDGGECKALLIVNNQNSLYLLFGNWVH